MHFIAVFLIAIITAVLNDEAELPQHIDASFLVLLRLPLLVSHLSGVESLSPECLAAVQLGKLCDVAFLDLFVLDKYQQVTGILDDLLLCLRRTILVESLLKSP